MYVRLKPGVGILLPARSFSKTPSYDCIEKKTSSPILIWTKIGNTWKSHCANRNITPLYFGVNARIPSEFFDQSQNCIVLIGTSIRVPTYCSEQFKLRIKMMKMYFVFSRQLLLWVQRLWIRILTGGDFSSWTNCFWTLCINIMQKTLDLTLSIEIIEISSSFWHFATCDKLMYNTSTAYSSKADCSKVITASITDDCWKFSRFHLFW